MENSSNEKKIKKGESHRVRWQNSSKLKNFPKVQPDAVRLTCDLTHFFSLLPLLTDFFLNFILFKNFSTWPLLSDFQVISSSQERVLTDKSTHTVTHWKKIVRLFKNSQSKRKERLKFDRSKVRFLKTEKKYTLVTLGGDDTPILVIIIASVRI